MRTLLHALTNTTPGHLTRDQTGEREGDRKLLPAYTL